MGVDLTLLFVDCGDDVSFTQIECHRDYDLHKEIKALKPFERQEIILNSYCGTSGFGETVKTPYGEPITYLKVEQLVTAFENWELKHYKQYSISMWNFSILQFLRSINYHSPKVYVALYWH